MVGRREMHADFLLGNMNETCLLKDVGVNGRILLKWVLWKQDGRAWTGFIWIRIGISDGLLQTQWRSFGLYNNLTSWGNNRFVRILLHVVIYNELMSSFCAYLKAAALGHNRFLLSLDYETICKTRDLQFSRPSCLAISIVDTLEESSQHRLWLI